MTVARENRLPAGPDTGAVLSDFLPHWARHRGGDTAVTFVDHAADPAGQARSLTWRELHDHVAALAHRLTGECPPGARAAVTAGNGLEYVVGFLAALHAGLVAVPLFDPRLPAQGDRLAGVLDGCDPAVVLTAPDVAAPTRAFLADRGPSHRPRVTVVDLADPPPSAPPAAGRGMRPGDVAYLQYTSGSTREPAGVAITHAAAIANVGQIAAAFDLTAERSRAVSWLPLYHDMGLLSALLAPLVTGFPAVLMDPLAFVQRPVRWLRLLAEHPGAYAAAPNFAFDHCARRVREADRGALRLDGVDWLINGSEPVRADTITRFHEAFSVSGLRPASHRPAYGLAEATVLVAAARGTTVAWFDRDALASGKAVPSGPDEATATSLVAAGRPAGQDVAIVDPRTGLRCPDGIVGEIWVHGPNVGSGYWQDPEATQHAFRATLAGDTGPGPAGPWLRTGDLGVWHDGQLYVTGRIKDLVIVDGRNHYPQDIEATVAAAHPAVRRGRAAAFAVPTGDGERLVVIAERAADHEPADPRAVGTAVRRAVAEHHGIGVHDFALVAAGVVPRTSSGKLGRGACRDRYLAGALLAPEARR